MSVAEATVALRLAFYGAKTPYPQLYEELITQCSPPKESRLFNPPPEILLEEIKRVIPPESLRLNLKRDLGISKGSLLQFLVAFTDQRPYPAFIPRLETKGILNDLIDEVERWSISNNLPTPVPQQLSLALKITQNRLTEAVMALAISTRIMARNYDSELLKVDEARMKNWYRCVACFGYDQNTFDPPGDTYHFWSAVLAGISSQENRENKYELVTGAVCDFIYSHTAPATEFFRHLICHQLGKSHSTIDILGYNIGKALADA